MQTFVAVGFMTTDARALANRILHLIGHLAQTFLFEVMSVALPFASRVGSIKDIDFSVLAKPPRALKLCCWHRPIAADDLRYQGWRSAPLEPCAKEAASQMLEKEFCGKMAAGGGRGSRDNA